MQTATFEVDRKWARIMLAFLLFLAAAMTVLAALDLLSPAANLYPYVIKVVRLCFGLATVSLLIVRWKRTQVLPHAFVALALFRLTHAVAEIAYGHPIAMTAAQNVVGALLTPAIYALLTRKLWWPPRPTPE
ncbi:hypothetical protein BH11ARM2_BH11ARM2_31360 [soil metagenome]